MKKKKKKEIVSKVNKAEVDLCIKTMGCDCVFGTCLCTSHVRVLAPNSDHSGPRSDKDPSHGHLRDTPKRLLQSFVWLEGRTLPHAHAVGLLSLVSEHPRCHWGLSHRTPPPRLRVPRAKFGALML